MNVTRELPAPVAQGLLPGLDDAREEDGSTTVGVGANSIPESTSATAGSSPDIAALCRNVSAVVPALVVPTRRALGLSPALFLWESRTTNVDVMCVSNTTRPVAVSR